MLKSALWFIALTGCLTGSLVAQSGLSNYLPLTQGKQWMLKGGGNSEMSFEVTSASGGNYRVKWDNPFIQSEFLFTVSNGKYFLKSLTMNGQTAEMPPDTLYWDLNAAKGATWTSAIGKFVVTDRNRRIKGRNGVTYDNCVVIRETNKQGNNLFWVFAPDTGFVQFGEGGGAFVLERLGGTSRNTEVTTSSNSGEGFRRQGRERVARRPEYRAPVGVTANQTWIGLAANTFANEPFDARTIKARFEQSLQAGISYIYISPKWNEVEPDRNKGSFKDIDYQLGQAVSYGVPAVLHLRVVDTNQRSMPKDLMGKKFNDRVVKERLSSKLEAIVKRTNGKVKHYLVGNEIEGYFRSRKNEIGEYAELVSAAIATIKAAQPDALVSVSTGFDGLEAIQSTLKPIANQTDFLAVTYYPLSPDFTVRDAGTVRGDFAKILNAAGGKKILLQEVGYPSDPKNNSSEDKQAQFFSTFFDELRNHGNKFIGANICFMSDFSDELSDTFVKYYKAEGADKFRAFLKTLGLFDDRGRAKKSWDVFQAKTRQITGKGN